MERPLSAGDLIIVRLLVVNGCDINKKDKAGCWNLKHAIVEEHKAVVQHLVKSGADLDFVDKDGSSVFHFASGCESVEILQYLAQHTGTSWLRLVGKDGFTP